MTDVSEFSVTKSPTTSYAFTVKDNRKETTDYAPFFDRCKSFGVVVSVKVGELDSHNKLHYHGILEIPKGFYRKKLTMPGLSLKLVELYDLEGWTKYIQKDQPDPRCRLRSRGKGENRPQSDPLLTEEKIEPDNHCSPRELVQDAIIMNTTLSKRIF